MKYLYPQLNARLAIVGAVLILTLMFLTACSSSSDDTPPPPTQMAYCKDYTYFDGATHACTICYDETLHITFNSCPGGFGIVPDKHHVDIGNDGPKCVPFLSCQPI